MENHKDDILKKFLQDTFSDYEPEPSEASWYTIFSAIQPNQPTLWGKSKPWIASVLVVLTGVWLWYGSPKVEANKLEIAFNSNESVGTLAVENRNQSDDSQTEKINQSDDSQTEKIIASDDNQTEKPHQLDNRLTNPSDYRLTDRTNTTKQSNYSQTEKLHQLDNRLTNSSDYHLTNKTIANPRSEFSGTHSLTNLRQHSEQKKVNENVQTNTIAKHILVSGRMNTIATHEEAKVTKYPEEIIVKNNTPKEEEENHPTVEKRSDETVVLTNNLTAYTSERVEKLATDMTVSTSGRVGTLATDRGITSTLATGMENSIIEQVRYVRPTESLHNKDFTLTKIALNSPVITPIIMPNREVKPIRQHTYLSMSITPIQTYRILTINNHSVQNVQTSNLFDSERNGWQFDLGMIKPMGKLWNFRSNLSYLRMRQWSEYQIGTNELILRNTNNGNSVQGASTALEVVGQTVIESKNLHMIGLKMDVQRFFKITPKNRYFISTGTQLMYENTQKQSNLFLNISAGFQHIVSQTTFLTIEPTASYSLNNFNDSKSLLQTNGYNLGLKMGVSFRVK